MENSYAEGIAVGVAILRRRQFYADGQLRGLPKYSLRRRHRHLAVGVDAGRRRLSPFL
jgi:hypothetical protein